MFSNFVFFFFFFTMDSFVLTPRWIKGFAVFLSLANTLSALMNDTFVNVYVAEETQICLFNIKYFASRQILASAHYNVLLFEIYMLVPLRFSGVLMSTQIRVKLETTNPNPPHPHTSSSSSSNNSNAIVAHPDTTITIPSSTSIIPRSPSISNALRFSPLTRMTSDESRPPVRFLEERGKANNEEIDSKTEMLGRAPLLVTDSPRETSKFLPSRRVPPLSLDSSISLDSSLQPLNSNNENGV